ncbi:MAG: nucleotidyltransferase domain-containing protein [Candidatus Micrarchaeota archaeon]
MEAIRLLAQKGALPLLKTLQAYPKRQFSINELAKTSHVPFATAWNLVDKFGKANIVQVRLVGRTRAVEYKDSPFSRLISRMLELNSSPQRLSLPELRRILKTRRGIKEAYLFGSVASGKEKLESDIDVAILTARAVDMPGLMSSMLENYGVKVVPLTFKSREKFNSFLSDKKKVRLV